MPIETGAAGAGGSGSGGGGGGGGDASAANQVLGLTALDQIYDALVLVGTEATSADILAAINSLGDGATLADLATALAPLATEATQQDVLAALEAQGIDAAAVKAGVDLLVPDLDAVRVATEATAAATGTTADTDTSNTLVGLLKWIKARLPTALTSNGGLKTGLVEPIPNGSNTIGAVTGSGNFSSTNAVGSQSDGHSATIGTTTDAATATTVIGRLQKLVSLLPAALGGGGGLKSEGVGVAGTPAGGVVSVQGVAGGTVLPVSGTVAVTQSGAWSNGLSNWIGSTAPTVGQKSGANSIPVVLANDTAAFTFQPSSSPNVANYLPVRVNVDGSNYWSIMANSAGVSAPGNSPVIWSMTRGRLYSAASTPGIVYDMRLDTWGRTYSTFVPNLTADGTTDAKTRWPANGDLNASSNGVIVVKTTGGRIFMIDVYYTGSTASGLYFQLHNAASATTPTTATLRKSWPMNNGANIQIEWESLLGLELNAGIKFVASSTRLTTTIATAETFSASGEGA